MVMTCGRGASPISVSAASTAADSGRRGQDDGGARIVQCDRETLRVTLQLGREQRHRDGARLDRGEEPGDVVETLRGEYRDAVSAGRDLLHPCADGAHPRARVASRSVR